MKLETAHQLQLFDYLLNKEQERLDNLKPISDSSPKFVSYGGGVNSTAMLILLKANNIKPDYILFADTGGEHPHTYAYLEVFDKWLKSVGFPQITTVKYKGTENYETLEQDCLHHKALPSKAYGYGKCSAKYKVQPQQSFIKLLGLNERYINYVGIHAGEQSRLLGKNGKPKIIETKDYLTKYPLIENRIYQHHCIALIQSVGLPVPSKSSCFFCPSMKPTEILKLKEDYPDLYERAIAIENSGLQTAHSIKGLGRKFRWSDVGQLTEIEKAILDAQNNQCACVEEF